MYEKPDVTRYGGTELLDLMGPVETQYAQTTCDIMGTVTDDPIEYVNAEPGGDPQGLFDLSIPGARIDECGGLDDVEVLVNFVNGQPCEQIAFQYGMEDGVLVIKGNVQNIMGDSTCDPGDSPFSVDVELEYTGGAAPVQCYPCEEDNLMVEVEEVPNP